MTSPAYLLAVSGGVDSIFMLRFMAKNSNCALRVAHFNHGLREQAAEEEAMVRDMCRELGIECHVGYGDPEGMRLSRSLEAEARRQRYAFFDSIKASDELIVTGHHANDQLETIILRLMRGYPHDHLRMQPRSGDRYRPFLYVPKAEIVSQATKRRYRWLEDASNDDIRHERNWVRHVLIPEMSKGRNILKSMVYSSLTAERTFLAAEDSDFDPEANEQPRPSGPRL
nr:tRNA lysidine(34) synthetase TilS [Neorhizobium tomejilense]